MSEKQKAMRERLNELSKENIEIQDRRHERDKEKIDEHYEREKELHAEVPHWSPPSPFSREMRRLTSGGMPRSVVYSQKMKIPKKRKR